MHGGKPGGDFAFLLVRAGRHIPTLEDLLAVVLQFLQDSQGLCQV